MSTSVAFFFASDVVFVIMLKAKHAPIRTGSVTEIISEQIAFFVLVVIVIIGFLLVRFVINVAVVTKFFTLDVLQVH